MKLSKHFELAGQLLLIWIASIFLISSLLFIFNFSISVWNIIIPSILILIACGISFVKNKDVGNLFGLLAAFFIIGAAIIIAGWFYDISWDGLDYHQKSILQLYNGFNPFFQSAQPEQTYSNIWFNHYPKGPWIFSASLYSLTGNIEAGKSLNILLIIATLFIWLTIGLQTNKLPKWITYSSAFLIAFNPVSIYQSLSFYIDGLVSSLIFLLIGEMILIIQKPKLSRFVGLGAIFIIGLNTKFTGTAYIGFFGIVMFIFGVLFLKTQRYKKQLVVTYILSIFIALFIVGFNPYITNTIHYKHPFYPVYGDQTYNKAKILQGAGLEGFIEKSGVEKFFISIFSISTNSLEYSRDNLKIPFTIHEFEMDHISSPDLRLGGFGSWFSGALIFSFFGMVIILFKGWPGSLKYLIPIAVILASMFLSSEYWWARYAPQFWSVPLIVVFAAYQMKNTLTKIIGAIVTIILVINIGMVSINYVGQNIQNSLEIKVTLAEMHQSGQNYKVYLGVFAPWKIRLDDYKIPYIEVPANTLIEPEKLNFILFEPMNK